MNTVGLFWRCDAFQPVFRQPSGEPKLLYCVRPAAPFVRVRNLENNRAERSGDGALCVEEDTFCGNTAPLLCPLHSTAVERCGDPSPLTELRDNLRTTTGRRQWAGSSTRSPERVRTEHTHTLRTHTHTPTRRPGIFGVFDLFDQVLVF